MHIAQTKNDSIATGGAQYYLHGVPKHIKEFLRKRGTCPVFLQTPYGIANSSFKAVGKDHKISPSGKVVPGKVGHDRIQGQESIGEAIRYWYGIKGSSEFENIDLDAVIHPDEKIILIPTKVKMRRSKRTLTLEKIANPLSFNRDYQSKVWKKQIQDCRNISASDIAWAGSQIARIVTDHQTGIPKNVHESDLLRAAGALSVLGLDLSMYLVRGYDCPESKFKFAGFPSYKCAVEIKKRSSGFEYQMLRYDDLPRAVVLCIDHDMVNCPDHVDVLELSELAKYLCN